MEAAYRQPTAMRRLRTAILIAVVVELMAIAVGFITMFSWETPPLAHVLTLGLHIMHAFAWVSAAAVASGAVISETITMFAVVAYVTATILDGTAFGLRLFYALACSSLTNTVLFDSVRCAADEGYTAALLVASGALVAVSLSVAVMCMAMMALVRRHKRRVAQAVLEAMQWRDRARALWRVPRPMYYAQRWLRLAATFDIILTVILFGVYALGLSPNAVYTWTSWLQLPHWFMWLATRVVAGARGAADGAHRPEHLQLYVMGATGLLVADVVAFVMRLLGLLHVHATLPDDTIMDIVLIVAAWLILVVGGLMTLASLSYAINGRLLESWTNKWLQLLRLAVRDVLVLAEQAGGVSPTSSTYASDAPVASTAGSRHGRSSSSSRSQSAHRRRQHQSAASS